MTTLREATKRAYALFASAGVALPDGLRIRRTYAGWRQKSAGAWAWYLETPEGRESGYGACEAVSAYRIGFVEVCDDGTLVQTPTAQN